MTPPSDEVAAHQLGVEVTSLAHAWQGLGIDPDDFLRCAACGEYLWEPDNHDGSCTCPDD